MDRAHVAGAGSAVRVRRCLRHPKSKATPGGAPLAGWWHRVGAFLIDALILVIAGLLLALPWVRETSGPMPLGTVVLRWFAQAGGPGMVSIVPYVGAVGSLYSLLDSLWPLWDAQKQAIHDKVAKTNVVRVR